MMASFTKTGYLQERNFLFLKSLKGFYTLEGGLQIHWRNQIRCLYKNEKFLFCEILLNMRKQ